VHFSLWIGRYPEGPSLKVELEGVVHLRDIKFQGNAVRGARHILSFDSTMDADPKLRVAKELLIGAFNVPKYHPKSTAVIDHTLSFIGNQEGNLISFKNYQIFREAVSKKESKIDLYEIGPRCMMKVACILDGVMGGEVLYRSAVVKNILKKSKEDKRKHEKQNKPGEFNMFGE
jgi:ribosome biogenesis protein BRX1